MKFSWGVGITLTYVVFVVVVVGIVIYAHTIDVNLVTDNYYEKEINHQEQIEKVKRTESLSRQVETKLDSGYIRITFPPIFDLQPITGKINLFRPSDRNMDKTIEINLDSSLVQSIPTSLLQKGVWRIKIDWAVDNNSYYNEKIIMLN